MPPRSRRHQHPSQTTAFGRSHPNLQRLLLWCCEASPYLMLATIATGAGILKRPLWQRALLWRAALWSFLARWILVGCAITWSWNDWGREDEAQRRRAADAGSGGPQNGGGGGEEVERRDEEQLRAELLHPGPAQVAAADAQVVVQG
jgi:hypothetical protein